MNKTLLETAIKLMDDTDVPVTTLCRETNVTTRWYYMLRSGVIKDPSVNKIQRIYDFLKDKSAGSGDQST